MQKQCVHELQREHAAAREGGVERELEERERVKERAEVEEDEKGREKRGGEPIEFGVDEGLPQLRVQLLLEVLETRVFELQVGEARYNEV